MTTKKKKSRKKKKGITRPRPDGGVTSARGIILLLVYTKPVDSVFREL